jgi:hypothetical protein
MARRPNEPQQVIARNIRRRCIFKRVAIQALLVHERLIDHHGYPQEDIIRNGKGRNGSWRNAEHIPEQLGLSE